MNHMGCIVSMGKSRALHYGANSYIFDNLLISTYIIEHI